MIAPTKSTVLPDALKHKLNKDVRNVKTYNNRAQQCLHDINNESISNQLAQEIYLATAQPSVPSSHPGTGTDSRSRSAKHRSSTLFEYACSSDSMLGQVSSKYSVHHVGLSRDFADLNTDAAADQLIDQINRLPEDEGKALWRSIPCTA